MKKTTKTAKTPAPANKTTAPAPARKSAPAPKIKVSAASKPSAPAVVTKPRGSRVTLIAKVDVGFGNTLFVRGDGPGLSWEKGTALDCSANDAWTLVLPVVERPFAFKLVLNDTVWSTGEDYSAAPGDTVTVTPCF